ncbi:anti-sigma factor family protein [Acidihalobacter prosperus]
MKCQSCRRYISQYLNGELPADVSGEFRDHIQGCPSCREQCEWERRIWNELRTLPVPPMSEGFVDQAIATAVQQHQQTAAVSNRRRSRMVGMAVAASLLAGMGIGIIVQRYAGHNNAPVMQLAKGQDTVRLVFNASKPINGVRFTVVLPPGVEMTGYPGKHKIVWHGRLKRGKNLLSLPLVAEHTGQGMLQAKVQYGHYARKIEVGIDVNNKTKTSHLKPFQQTTALG